VAAELDIAALRRLADEAILTLKSGRGTSSPERSSSDSQRYHDVYLHNQHFARYSTDFHAVSVTIIRLTTLRVSLVKGQFMMPDLCLYSHPHHRRIF